MTDDVFWFDTEESWQARLASWLAIPQWSRQMAAYLLIGLDPEWTHGPCDKHCVDPHWVTPHGKDSLPADKVASEHELETRLNLLLEETQRADRSEVATPSEWLEWSVRMRLEPPWLKAACGDKRLRLLLPDLPPYRALGKDAGLQRDFASAGGKRRQELSRAGKAKRSLLPSIREWVNNPTAETAKAFAERLQDRLDRTGNELDVNHPWAEIPTILRWIRQEKQRPVSRRPSAG